MFLDVPYLKFEISLGMFWIPYSRRHFQIEKFIPKCQFHKWKRSGLLFFHALSPIYVDLVFGNIFAVKHKKNERSSANEVPSPSEGFTNGLVSGWYSSNIAVLVLNKYLLSNNDFKYSIFLTHVMNACLLFSITWLKILLVSPQVTQLLHYLFFFCIFHLNKLRYHVLMITICVWDFFTLLERN